MKKRLFFLVFTSVLVFTGCAKKEEVTLDADKVIVSKSGEFQLTGTSKQNSSFYVNDQMITSKEQEKDGKYTVTVKMDQPEEKATFKIKYLSEELLDRKITFDTSEFEKGIKESSEQATKDSVNKKTADSIRKEEKTQKQEYEDNKRKEDSDITKLSETPTDDQKITLNGLAKQKFNTEFPYKGSKIHTLKGKIQDWTAVDNKWFYKAEATIVNEYGTKKESTVEVRITPINQDSGEVEMLEY